MAKDIKMKPATRPSASDEIPAGMVLVEKAQLDQLRETLTTLTTQKKELSAACHELTSDLATILTCLAVLAPIVGNEGLSMNSVMKLVQKKDELAKGIAPMMAVVEKYTTAAAAKQNG